MIELTLMISYVWRFCKRFAVLIPGLIIAYISARDVFPYFDKRLPLGIAVFVTYAIGAYVLIPAILRLWRIIVPAKHLPLYCVTPDGYASDPLNVGLIGSRVQLIHAMETAGWHLADPYTLPNIAREIFATIFKKLYRSAPMSSLYLFGRRQDLGFEIQLTQEGRGHRHHVRFWATTFDSVETLSTHTIHWHKRKQELFEGNLLWVGAASRDIGLAFVRQTAQITHMIDPDTDRERELIVAQLKANNVAEPITNVRLNHPYRLVNRAWRLWSGHLLTDGEMTVMRLTLK